uniref:LRR receptor-like serine/threonine-protein kinase FLS2 n=1 Tax=Aegilops tauschii TaxID=37682 RepID=M8CFA3_AEGTA
MCPTATTKLLLLLAVAASTIPFTSHGLVHVPRQPASRANGTGTGTMCLPHEREALLAFKRGITKDASWQRHGLKDCCRWRGGVQCDDRTGHVLELHLRNLHANNTLLIDDQLAALVGDMKSLQVLTFSTDSLGFTTASMKNLRNLEALVLDLSHSLLDENIRDTFERLPRCSPNKLKELHLENNNITGVLPDFIGEFINIVILDLSSNHITGHVPPEIGRFKNLTSLDLSSNRLGGVITQEHFVAIW